MIHDIEEFSSELHMEALRNSLDRLVLKHREIQIRCPRPGQKVATGIASKIETLRVRDQERGSSRVRRLGVRRSWVAIISPSSLVGPGGDRKALGLDIVSGIS